MGKKSQMWSFPPFILHISSVPLPGSEVKHPPLVSESDHGCMWCSARLTQSYITDHKLVLLVLQRHFITNGKKEGVKKRHVFWN